MPEGRRVLSVREVAQRLDVPVEMVRRHGLSGRVPEATVVALEAEPPAWLLQSRANRTGAPVWVELACVVCGHAEKERPKKWWPEWTHLSCFRHAPTEAPAPAEGTVRREVDGIGSQFVALVDEPVA
ncbi:hypothetical protein GCM10027282_19910 [Frigoribacterium salinisoli]